MGRSKSLPRYPSKKHSSGQARIVLSQKTHYLGPFESPESFEKYARLIAEYKTHGTTSSISSKEATVEVVLAAYLEHSQRRSENRDRKGRWDTMRSHLQSAMREVRSLYGSSPASRFGGLSLETVREQMVARGWTRSHVNRLVRLVQRIFIWAVAKEMIPATVRESLLALAPLQRGESKAPELAEVPPVDPSIVELTLPYLAPSTAAVVRLQLLTGARAGEILILRACDLSMSGSVWHFRPHYHKSDYLNKDRLIYLGPQAQEIVRTWLTLDTQQYLFSSPRGVRPYTVSAFGHNLECGILRANRARAKQGLSPIPAWHSHQLRHTAGTRARAEGGPEAAQVILGHSTLSMMERYARPDQQRAAEVIGRIG